MIDDRVIVIVGTYDDESASWVVSEMPTNLLPGEVIGGHWMRTTEPPEADVDRDSRWLRDAILTLAESL